ncbi:hypothetical protein DSO57_1023129 [Entomophthora muscae]|uniref:Uncharacterized protein n=1 Tax=Entomophthora muscae TaxID=34485 RepID=A0ACC2UMU2_9FUNG|nr:hypothetical protein DSO57_1023129 [Entomophthora muscae]
MSGSNLSSPVQKIQNSSSISKVESQLVSTSGAKQFTKATKPVALEEDVYTSAIDQIIERDFFPDLLFLRERQKEVISLSPSATPSNVLEKRNTALAGVNIDCGLDRFFQKYTSEDNASFSEILEKTNAERKERYHWLYKEGLSRSKNIEAPKPQQAITGGTINSEETGLVKLSVKENLEIPTETENPREKQTTQTWTYEPKNSLMYFPEGCYSTLELTEAYKRGQPKSISHENTRLKGFSFDTAPSTPTTISSVNTGQPKKYDLVDSTPAPDPSALGGDNPMTWGFLESTPIALSGNSTPGPSFKLPEPKQRELIGLKLSEKARISIRNRQLAKTPYQRSNAASPGTCLSPAGRRLLESSQRIRSPLIPSGDRQLRDAYGAKGLRTPSQLATPRDSSAASILRSKIVQKRHPLSKP